MKHIKTLGCILLILALATSVFAKTKAPEEPKDITEKRTAMLAAVAKEIKQIDVKALRTMIKQKQNFVLLDVRTDAEVKAAKIPAKGFKNIARGLVEWVAPLQVKRDAKIVVVCKSGGRASFVTKLLQDFGYKNVVNLKGGMIAWMEAGYPVQNFMGMIKPKGYKNPWGVVVPK